MSVSTSFPGIYIQELPASSHAIVPAPTSIAAFIGYSHPFKTANPGVAQQIFSFTDYQTYFGGLFTSGLIDSSLPRAVYQFFLNGGSSAYVVGLQPGLFTASGTLLARFGSGNAQFTATVTTDSATQGLLFTALEPADIVPMTVTLTNLRNSGAVFDVVVSYGTSIETYRGVPIASADTLINKASSLIHVGKLTGGPGTKLNAGAQLSLTLDLATNFATYATSFSVADFVGTDSNPGVFQANSSLDNVEIFNLLLVPGVADNGVISAALAFAEHKRAFAILDPPPQAIASGASTGAPQPIQYWMTGLQGVSTGYSLPRSQNGALYFPYLTSSDPVTGQAVPMPPSGFVAGIYAATDASRGVWKAPAGLATTVLNTSGPVAGGTMNDPQNGVLNLDSINCLRSFSGIGTVVWGSRTLVANNQAFAQSMYVPVRRMTLFIEQTLLANLRWVVFEPNDEPLWAAIRSSIEAFLLSLFRQGGLQGSTPSEAFQVKCDATTTTSTDQANGIVNIVVAFAPLKPAEFVIVKIAQLAGQPAS